MNNILLVGLWAVLQMLDVATTYIGLASGKAVEVNPVMRLLMKCLGVRGALLVKAAIAIGAGAFLYTYPPILAIVDVLYLGIVVNNLYTLHKAGEL